MHGSDCFLSLLSLLLFGGGLGDKKMQEKLCSVRGAASFRLACSGQIILEILWIVPLGNSFDEASGVGVLIIIIKVLPDVTIDVE